MRIAAAAAALALTLALMLAPASIHAGPALPLARPPPSPSRGGPAGFLPPLPAVRCGARPALRGFAPLCSARTQWDALRAREKDARFWAFFRTDAYAATRSVYACDAGDGGAGSVAALRSRKTHSIEHVVPRSTLRRLLAHADAAVQRGAALDPFNWLPAARSANSARSAREYDVDGDAVVRPPRSGGGACTGVDRDGEWVVPGASRGEVARAVLYMTLAYQLAGYLSPTRAEAFLAWHLADPPQPWERAYVAWVRGERVYAGLEQPLVEARDAGDARGALVRAVRAELARLAVSRPATAPKPAAVAGACRACALAALWA